MIFFSETLNKEITKTLESEEQTGGSGNSRTEENIGRIKGTCL